MQIVLRRKHNSNDSARGVEVGISGVNRHTPYARPSRPSHARLSTTQCMLSSFQAPAKLLDRSLSELDVRRYLVLPALPLLFASTIVAFLIWRQLASIDIARTSYCSFLHDEIRLTSRNVRLTSRLSVSGDIWG
jgi:hypothetical protein